jgi:uncharacterized phiE125 gp8 family phage protein
VTLAEAKAQCRVSHTSEDTLIQTYIVAATNFVERQISFSLMTRTYALSLDEFTDAIELPRGPVSQVTSVQYVNPAGTLTTISPSMYTVDLSSRPQWIVRNSSAVWPNPMDGVNMVTVTYKAGADVLPDTLADLKAAILLLIGHWYVNRETVSIANMAMEIPYAVTSLLDGYREVLI